MSFFEQLIDELRHVHPAGLGALPGVTWCIVAAVFIVDPT
jgi:hypothetical protein